MNTSRSACGVLVVLLLFVNSLEATHDRRSVRAEERRASPARGEQRRAPGVYYERVARRRPDSDDDEDSVGGVGGDYDALTTLSVRVPESNRRDPGRCEIYETVDYDYYDYQSGGCELHCIVDGYVGSVRLRDVRSRRVAACRPAGSLCRPLLHVHAKLNVSLADGRCNAACDCLPTFNERSTRSSNDGDSDSDSDGDSEGDNETPDTSAAIGGGRSVNRRRATGSLVAIGHHSGWRPPVRRLRDGYNRFDDLLELRVPPARHRNRTHCEPYEVDYIGEPAVLGVTAAAAWSSPLIRGPAWERRAGLAGRRHAQCTRMCALAGQIGGVQFEGLPRELPASRPDGAYCELLAPVGLQDEVRLSGVDHLVEGRCVDGVCRPLSPEQAQDRNDEDGDAGTDDERDSDDGANFEADGGGDERVTEDEAAKWRKFTRVGVAALARSGDDSLNSIGHGPLMEDLWVFSLASNERGGHEPQGDDDDDEN